MIYGFLDRRAFGNSHVEGSDNGQIECEGEKQVLRVDDQSYCWVANGSNIIKFTRQGNLFSDSIIGFWRPQLYDVSGAYVRDICRDILQMWIVSETDVRRFGLIGSRNFTITPNPPGTVKTMAVFDPQTEGENALVWIGVDNRVEMYEIVDGVPQHVNEPFLTNYDDTINTILYSTGKIWVGAGHYVFKLNSQLVMENDTDWFDAGYEVKKIVEVEDGILVVAGHTLRKYDVNTLNQMREFVDPTQSQIKDIEVGTILGDNKIVWVIVGDRVWILDTNLRKRSRPIEQRCTLKVHSEKHGHTDLTGTHHYSLSSFSSLDYSERLQVLWIAGEFNSEIDSDQVTATPDECYEFDHWELKDESGNVTYPAGNDNGDGSNTISIRIDQNYFLRAFFKRSKYTLTMRANIDVTMYPSIGDHHYPIGRLVFVKPPRLPAGSRVSYWMLDGRRIDRPHIYPITITMDKDHVMEVFIEQIA